MNDVDIVLIFSCKVLVFIILRPESSSGFYAHTTHCRSGYIKFSASLTSNEKSKYNILRAVYMIMPPRFAVSTSGMAHDLINETYTFVISNKARCGASVSDRWERIDAEDRRDLAVMHRPLKYCSQCFGSSHKLTSLQRKCDEDVEVVCSWN